MSQQKSQEVYGSPAPPTKTQHEGKAVPAVPSPAKGDEVHGAPVNDDPSPVAGPTDDVEDCVTKWELSHEEVVKAAVYVAHEAKLYGTDGFVNIEEVVAGSEHWVCTACGQRVLDTADAKVKAQAKQMEGWRAEKSVESFPVMLSLRWQREDGSFCMRIMCLRYDYKLIALDPSARGLIAPWFALVNNVPLFAARMLFPQS